MSTSQCGSEVLAVSAPPKEVAPAATTTSASQSGGGSTGSSIRVPVGTTVTDTAVIGAGGSGTVTYTLYSDSACTKVAAPGGTAAVSGGAAGPSSAVSVKAGTYYRRASYSGDGTHLASVSACGSQILVVARKATLGLPSPKACLSLRRFIIHPRAPKGVKLVRVEIQINGERAAKGRLTAGHTTLSLIGLPKGTFKVALIAKSSTGRTYEDLRTFHTCIPGKHKKTKKK